MGFIAKLRNINLPVRNPIVQWLWKKLKNKYVLTFLVFLVWITFIDENNLVARFSSWQRYNELEQTKEFYTQKIKADKKEMHRLEDNRNLERLARERYLMKKENEEIFLMIENK